MQFSFSSVVGTTEIDADKLGILRIYKEQKLCHKQSALAWGGHLDFALAPAKSVSLMHRSGTEIRYCALNWCRIANDDSAAQRARRPAYTRGPCQARAYAMKGTTMTDSADAILSRARKRGAELALPYFGAVSPQDAHALLAATRGATLVDVRTRAEWDYVGRIPQSTLVEWNMYPDGARNPRFMEELKRAASDPSAPVLFLCRSGHRSDAAARAAAAAGYEKALNILEGFEGDKDATGQRGKLGGWRKNGLPWVQG
jgi:rhodanese-related sulfurtransferase